MPIEIRPSDVMAQTAEAFGKWGDVAHGIFTAEYEKERVKEENEGLVLIEQSFQKAEESRPKQVYEVPRLGPEGESDPTQAVGPELKPLGAIPRSTLESDMDKQVEALRTQIQTSVHNKRARENLLMHLAAGEVQYRARARKQWLDASTDYALAGLNSSVEVVMQSEVLALPKQKIEAIRSRAVDVKNAGYMTNVQYEKFMADIEGSIWQTHALNETLRLATATTEPVEVETEQGKTTLLRPLSPEKAMANAEDFLNSLDYYKSRPIEREKLFDEILRKYDRFTTENDKAVDSKFAMLHLKAATVEAIDSALAELVVEKIYDGDKRYIWEQRLQAKKDDFLRMAAAGVEEEEAPPEAAKKLEDLYWSDATTDEYSDALSRMVANKEITGEIGREWLKKDDERGTRQNQYKIRGGEAIHEAFATAQARVKNGTSDKDKAKYQQLLIDEVKMMERYTQEVAGEEDSNVIMAAALKYIKIDMPPLAEFKVGDMDFTDRGKVRDLVMALRDQTTPLSLLPQDAGKLATALTTMLAKDFGAAGAQYTGEQRAYGNPMVQVKGLEPGRPNDSFMYFLDVDEDGNLVMMRWNKKNDPEPTKAPTLAIKRSVDVKAATAEAIAKGLTGAEAAQFIQDKVGGIPLGAEELKPIPTGKLPGEIEISAKQLTAFYKWIKGKKSFNEAEISSFSVLSGIPVSQLKTVLTNRGLEVKP